MDIFTDKDDVNDFSCDVHSILCNELFDNEYQRIFITKKANTNT